MHQKCELLLCTEYCIRTHTHTHTHVRQLPLGSGPSTQHHFHAGSSNILSPGKWPQQNSIGVVITELKDTRNNQILSYFEEILPKPVSTARQQARQEGAAWAGWKDMCVCARSEVSASGTPWTAARQAPLSMGFPGKSTGVGCHFLLQGIFSTQGSNLGLVHCRQTLYRLSHQGSPDTV